MIQLVAARLSDVDGWAEVAATQSPTLVVIDQAVDLRRTLADAAYLARGVLEDVPTTPAWNETRLAAAAVASLLDAAGHTVSPVATALCRQDDLHATAQLSAVMTRRFLKAAAAAAADLQGLLEHATPGAGPGCQHLWAVP
ncbi:hypothetical protein [uncultured Serinicoccus sp.]|uniref:hypothetical protein n=1 Tax=uncultured Serinicoccus sp. TaxID=735514 RepID=UPI00262D3CCF|nr:hypothetical protein [uncultured Serinicoccus sp.]